MLLLSPIILSPPPVVVLLCVCFLLQLHFKKSFEKEDDILSSNNKQHTHTPTQSHFFSPKYILPVTHFFSHYTTLPSSARLRGEDEKEDDEETQCEIDFHVFDSVRGDTVDSVRRLCVEFEENRLEQYGRRRLRRRGSSFLLRTKM